MSLPEAVRNGVESALEERLGKGVRVRSSTPVGGGCINPSARLLTDLGESWFLKWNSSADPQMFGAEADGLEGLRRGARTSSQGIRVPEVVGWGGAGTPMDPTWLLLEFIPSGSPGPQYGARLGEGLAYLHSSAASAFQRSGAGPYGWSRDNFIGSLPQDNTPSPDWLSFWRERRLEPQLRRAREGGYLTGRESRVLDDLLNRLDGVMTGAEAPGPALLHGDLWSGNYYAGPAGEPVVIDPAVYQGAGEVDVAMMELFGSLPRGFREAYGGIRPLAAEYDAFRRDLYQLYYLLVHVNLFGGSYVPGALASARRALAGI